MPPVRSRSPQPAPAKIRTRVAAPRRPAKSAHSPPAKKRRGTYATPARREKAEAFFQEYRRDRDELLRKNPQRAGETREEWSRRICIPNDETLRAIAENKAGIGILKYESREAAWKDLGVL